MTYLSNRLSPARNCGTGKPERIPHRLGCDEHKMTSLHASGDGPEDDSLRTRARTTATRSMVR